MCIMEGFKPNHRRAAGKCVIFEAARLHTTKSPSACAEKQRIGFTKNPGTGSGKDGQDTQSSCSFLFFESPPVSSSEIIQPEPTHLWNRRVLPKTETVTGKRKAKTSFLFH